MQVGLHAVGTHVGEAAVRGVDAHEPRLELDGGHPGQVGGVAVPREELAAGCEGERLDAAGVQGPEERPDTRRRIDLEQTIRKRGVHLGGRGVVVASVLDGEQRASG